MHSVLHLDSLPCIRIVVIRAPPHRAGEKVESGDNKKIATLSTTGKEILLSEQWVLVTEGARGLGAAITRALLREVAHVVVNYRKSEMLAYALRDESGDRVLPIQADVTDAAAVARLFFLSPWARAVTGQNLIVDGGLVKG